VRTVRLRPYTITLIIAVLLTAVAGPLLRIEVSEGTNLTTRGLQLSDARTGLSVTYKMRLGGVSAGNVGSIRLQLCANDPFPGQPCTAPVGLSASGTTLLSQSGMTGFSVHSSSTANEIILTRVPFASVATVATYELSNITNPSAVGTYYGRIETFASTDATGPQKDKGGLAFDVQPGPVSVSTTVPPYLLFCVGATIQPYDCSTATNEGVDFGEFSPSRTATGKTQLLAATNADFGYNITVNGPTLTSGVNVINPLSSPDISRVGTSQFGLNLRANSTPPAGQEILGAGTGSPGSGYGNPNYYRFNPGTIVASSSNPDYYRLYTATYIVNVSRNQAPGVYVSTLNFIALATF